MRKIHIFAQQLWLEDWNHQLYAYCKSWSDPKYGIGPNRDEHPPFLKITLRHTDWWYFLLGENSPLALDPRYNGRSPPRFWSSEDRPFMENSWGTRFSLLKGLKVFQLELETLREKEKELNQVVEQAMVWRLPLGDGKILICDRERGDICVNLWTGSKHFKGKPGMADPEPYERRRESRSGSTSLAPEASSQASTSRKNSLGKISKMIDKRKRSGSNELTDEISQQKVVPLEVLEPEDRLDYYVVTLTFRAQDPESLADSNIAGFSTNPGVGAGPTGISSADPSSAGMSGVGVSGAGVSGAGVSVAASSVPGDSTSGLAVAGISAAGPSAAGPAVVAPPVVRPDIMPPLQRLPRQSGFPSYYG